MRRVAVLFISALIAVGVLAAPASAHGHRPDRPDRPERTNIVDTLVERSGGGSFDHDRHDYDILVQAVLAADLAGVLCDTSTRFTVFAPDDAAFMATVRELTGTWPASEQATFEAVASFGIPVVTEVLLYHVVAGRSLNPIQVLFSHELTMANGGTVRPWFLSLRDADPDNGNARLRIRGLNIKASNGVIHTIDRVLRPIDL